jgi:hypothetical protein
MWPRALAWQAAIAASRMPCSDHMASLASADLAEALKQLAQPGLQDIFVKQAGALQATLDCEGVCVGPKRALREALRGL